MNDAEQSQPLLEHAWRYFELHANQRISVFNFFLALSGTIAAGLAGTLQGSSRFASLGIALGSLLALVAFIFWKLDQRVSFLIKHAEGAMAEMERALPKHSARLFHAEPERTSDAKMSASFWTRHWTFGRSFRLVFWAMGVTGVAGALLSAGKALGLITL